MTTIDLTVPETIKEYIEKQASKEGYRLPADFVVALVQAHQERRHRLEVESMLLEAVDGPFTEWTDADVEDIRRQGAALISQRKGA
jgi:antitoxin ParD1/3/4